MADKWRGGPRWRKERAEAEREGGERVESKYKKTRREILDEIDEFLDEEVVDRAAKAGYPKLGAAVAAGLSAAGEMTPSTPTEAALAATGVGAVAGKLNRVRKAGERAREGKKAAKELQRSVRKEAEAERALPEKPFVTDEQFRRGYYTNKIKKQRRLDRKRGKTTTNES